MGKDEHKVVTDTAVELSCKKVIISIAEKRSNKSENNILSNQILYGR